MDDSDLDDPDHDDPDQDLPPEDLTDEELDYALAPPDPVEVAEAARGRRERAQRWRHLPDEPPPAEPEVTPDGVGSVIRAIRWRTGASQRELAAAAHVSLSTVIRLEAESGSDVRLSTLERITASAGLRLALVDEEGTHLAIPFGQDHFHDQGDRLLPAHRPVYDPRGRYWWGYGLLQQPDPRHPAPTRVFRGRRPVPRRDAES